MSKSLLNAQRLVLKINSKRLRYSNWDLKVSLEEAKKNEELVSLGDSITLRMIRQIRNCNVTEDDIKLLHKLFYSQIDESNAGEYRANQVIITVSDVELPKPEELNSKMAEFINSLAHLKETLHPVEYAAMVHIIFVNIHPFVDGNGRVARLLMNLALLQSGYNIVVIPPVVRTDYISALKDSNVGNYVPFVNFISEMVLESQKEYLKIISRF